MKRRSPSSPDGGDEALAPAAVYRRRLDEREELLAALRRRDGLLANLRLGVAGVGLVVGWLALLSRIVPPGWIALPVVVYCVLAWIHAAMLRRRDLAARAVRFYAAGLERLEDRWQGRGRSGEAFDDPEHPYAGDLDLFGAGSLFELLSTARTAPGERTLAGWLLAPGGRKEVEARQAAVAELAERLDLREALALAGAEVSFELDPDDLVRWAREEPATDGRWPTALAWIGAAINVGSLVAWWRLSLGSLPLLPAIVLGGGLGLALSRKLGPVLEKARRPQRELALWASMSRILEGESFASARLVELCEALRRGGGASARIAALARLVDWSESRRNTVFAPIAVLLFVGTHLAVAIERWRRDCGGEVAGWVRAMGELEALSSLASFAYERPDHPFPRLTTETVFEAEALGHPLLPASACVPNDVRLGESPRLLLVSGSNMSGKSTLLRSVGVNAVLALAGAPVRASRLRLGALAVGASLRVMDSLQEGTSRFYAEIRRLRRLNDLAGEGRPLLFLLDEILHGTNSHDRRIGAEGVLRGLLAAGAVGLVTTHDLALAEIARDLGPLAANVHFQDRLEEGRMIFDYRLRDGVVEKSNALDLMRGLGLDV